MKDLIKLMAPKYIEEWGKFTPRGGISIDPYCNYGKPGTRWEAYNVKMCTIKLPGKCNAYKTMLH